jgi:hypothetical protein
LIGLLINRSVEIETNEFFPLGLVLAQQALIRFLLKGEIAFADRAFRDR